MKILFVLVICQSCIPSFSYHNASIYSKRYFNFRAFSYSLQSHLTEEDILGLTVPKLKEECKRLKLRVSGNKAALQQRIISFSSDISQIDIDSPGNILLPECSTDAPLHSEDMDIVSMQSNLLQEPDSSVSNSFIVTRPTEGKVSSSENETVVNIKDAVDSELSTDERSYFATCPRGLERILRDELEGVLIRASKVKMAARGCSFFGDVSVGYRALLWLRTAHRVMELIASASDITDKEAVYDLVSRTRWSDYMRPNQSLQVDAVLGLVPEGLTHSHFTALTVKNAIVDQFRSASPSSERPSVDTDDPDLPLVIYLDSGKAMLYRSLSGVRSMHKRGYRSAMHVASLKENVAAGLIQASGWNPDTQSICDPMCGSGTLAIEAALIALRRAPGLQAMGYFTQKVSRKMARIAGIWAPSVSYWPGFCASIWQEEVRAAASVAIQQTKCSIVANDWHEGAISLAYGDATRAGVAEYIQFFNEDVLAFTPPEKPDLVLTNPPWDMRLGGATDSWRALLHFLKRHCAGSTAWTLSGNAEVTRELRMKSNMNMYLTFGGTELRWLQYSIHADKGNLSASSEANVDGKSWFSNDDTSRRKRRKPNKKLQIGRGSDASRVPW